jgi:lipopolysaccharide transport system ATP-binding protein
MNDVVIDIDCLGKSYVLGRNPTSASYGSLRESLTEGVRHWLKPFGPLRSRKSLASPEFGLFWALRDVSLKIRDGERVGIIGKNGAGKSTLLKVLSRITEPTMGKVTIAGRMTSLLEVGTGFHPELTGRENIYLSGAILGMSRINIAKSFDQIVAFAEVEQFLDTPVKRYSSGMYVRLAFSVAAHLESEILAVDEVLAVGDAEFQRKCLARMGDVSRGGKTTLFVSHNMAAVSQLCTRGVVLSGGGIVFDGEIKNAIQHYMDTGPQGDAITEYPVNLSKPVQIKSIAVCDLNGVPRTSHDWNADLYVQVKIEARKTVTVACVVQLITADGVRVFQLNSANYFKKLNPLSNGQAIIYQVRIKGGILNPGSFGITAIITEGNVGNYDSRSSSTLWLEAMTPTSDFIGQRKKDLSLMRLSADWTINPLGQNGIQ